ncbi:unnamed protein product, partial [Amoebophrya sp. A25]|eukprot:GSA25T00012352001.1
MQKQKPGRHHDKGNPHFWVQHVKGTDVWGNSDFNCCQQAACDIQTEEYGPCSFDCSGLGWRWRKTGCRVHLSEKGTECWNGHGAHVQVCFNNFDFNIAQYDYESCGGDRYCVTPWTEWRPSQEDCNRRSETRIRSRENFDFRGGVSYCSGSSPRFYESVTHQNACYRQPCTLASETTICGGGRKWKNSAGDIKCAGRDCTAEA